MTITTETDREALQHAQDAVADALEHYSLAENPGQWQNIQQAYIRLRWAERAMSDELEETMRFCGYGPRNGFSVQQGYARLFGGFKAPDPANPFTERVVTIDHIVDTDGEVHVEINGRAAENLTADYSEPAPYKPDDQHAADV